MAQANLISDVDELRRLTLSQRRPQRYVERRVEKLNLESDFYYSVEVVQQFVVPILPGPGGVDPSVEPRQVLVPIGYHGKSLLPDLRVSGPDGSELPVLNRVERGRAMAFIFTTPWEEGFVTAISAEARPDGRAVWRQVLDFAAEIATESRDDASLFLSELREWLTDAQASYQVNESVRESIRMLLQQTAFWDTLEYLARTRIIIAKMSAVPGQAYVITSRHTERFSYESFGARWIAGALTWLGWTAAAVRRDVANLGWAQSLWVVQSLPDGVEPVRSFWGDHAGEVAGSASQTIASDRVIAGRYGDADRMAASSTLHTDVQLAPSASMASAMFVAAFLFVVATYIYQSPNLFKDSDTQANFIGIAGAFAGIPAAIAGALAYNGQGFARRVSRGPRALLMLMAAQAALLAAVVGFQRVDNLIAGSAYTLSVFCFFVIGAFGYVQFGPRWRKSERSRRATRTSGLTPPQCRRRQMRSAMIFFPALVLATIVFARVQSELRYAHFFTDDFPANIWRAWWSLFGL